MSEALTIDADKFVWADEIERNSLDQVHKLGYMSLERRAPSISSPVTLREQIIHYLL